MTENTSAMHKDRGLDRARGGVLLVHNNTIDNDDNIKFGVSRTIAYADDYDNDDNSSTKARSYR